MTQRFFRVLWMMFLFELGVILLFIPWLSLWESNYFLSLYPMLRPYLLHPSLRGFVTGLGALDIIMAAGMLRIRNGHSEVPGPRRSLLVDAQPLKKS